MPATRKMELKALCALIGRPVRIGAYESIDEIKLESDKASLRVIVHVITENHRELTIAQRGVRLMGWTRNESGPWNCEGVFTIWDEEFAPVIHIKRGRVMTPEQVRVQIDFERMCYRPGTPSQPLDNYDRVLRGDGHNSKKMDKHW